MQIVEFTCLISALCFFRRESAETPDPLVSRTFSQMPNFWRKTCAAAAAVIMMAMMIVDAGNEAKMLAILAHVFDPELAESPGGY